ncbi:MAG: hypothetical protein HFJ09_15770 [Lachnospiraceae bacterium]|nr:hypothetical protein [Lachnospiraceae bacterium]
MGVRYLGKGNTVQTIGNGHLVDIKQDCISHKINQNNKEIVYVSQDNYYVADLSLGKDIVYYCDSATSCIIIITVGYSEYCQKDVALISHLSRPGRFDDYFSKVNILFNKDVDIYASGANPPYPYLRKDGTYDYTALRNAEQTVKWISSGRVQVRQVSLKFGQGDPSIYTNNLDCYSITCDKKSNIMVNNNRIYLTNEQRDPTKGVQTLFCMYGNPMAIRLQTEEFSDEEIAALVQQAHDNNFEGAADMSDEEILATYSSTPEYEVPWFCDSIRQAGLFVKSYIG